MLFMHVYVFFLKDRASAFKKRQLRLGAFQKWWKTFFCYFT